MEETLDNSYQHISHTDEEMRTLVRDIYDQKIFCSLQVPEHENMMMVFMPLMFIMSPPTEPSYKKGGTIKEERKKKLNYISEKQHYDEVIYPQWEKETLPKIRAYVADTGMVYEEISKALPRSCNGYPIFASCHFLSKSDTKRFVEMYQKYEIKRKEFDKEF